MGFGDSITKLLETYTNCLKLLDAFRRQTDDAPDSDAASLLQRSIRSDRSKVRRRYASRLSESGRRLERGDDKSRSVLRRTLKKLNAAIVGLLHLGKTDSPVLDYDSLRRLSKTSRIDAINAIDQLSQRLGSSPSRRSLTSSAATVSSTGSGKGRRHRLSRPDTGATAPQPVKKPREAPKQPAQKGLRSAAGQQKGAKSAEPRKEVKRLSRSSGSKSSHKGDRDDVLQRRAESPASSRPSRTATGMTNRASMMTISTVSTKLGEIPDRRRRLQRQDSPGSYSGAAPSSEYNIRPTYPLKPYQSPPEPKSKGGFWGFLRR